MRSLIAAALLVSLSGCAAASAIATTVANVVTTGSAASTAVPWPTPDATADTTTADGLGYSIQVKAPAGAATAKAGQTVSVQYAGWLTNGTAFDNSFKTGKPFSFTLGAGQVIRGWDEGVAGMQVGERRKLVIPSALGYGAAGAPPSIPANATLLFDVALVSIQ